jgi:hypothetical protein
VSLCRVFLLYQSDSDTPAPPWSSMLWSVMSVKHISGAKWHVVGVCTRQRVEIGFLTAEGSSPIEIHRRLRSTFGEVAMDCVSVRCWVHYLKSSDKDIVYRPCSASAKSFVWPACSGSHRTGKTLVIMKKTLWESNLNFVTYVPMIFVNCSFIVLNYSF